MNRRAFRALFRRAFGRTGNGGAVASNTVFLMCILFVLALVVMATNLFLGRWIQRYQYYEGYHKVIIVNPPASLEQYLASTDEYPDKFIVRMEWHSTYDFTTFSDRMREEQAFMTVVFPHGFDDAVDRGETPEVLTFVLTDELHYAEWRDTIEDEPLYFYDQFLKESSGITVPSGDNVAIYENPVNVDGNISYGAYIAIFCGSILIPLMIFVATIYIAMSKGTNLISGMKENGTFLGILLTPVPVRTILSANLCGIWLSSLIPAFITVNLMMLVPYYFSFTGWISVILLVTTLSLFISSITMMVSIMNDTVVAAQTAFLPVFLILLAVCVMCIQGVEDIARFYYWIPVYGHFYGIGQSLIHGDISFSDVLICTASTLLLSFVMLVISENLLKSERFTAAVESRSDRSVMKQKASERKMENDYYASPRAAVFGYKPIKRSSHSSFLADQIFYPLAVLSLFQTLAMIPAFIAISKRSEFSDTILSLRGVSGIRDVIDRTFAIFAVLMNEPAFLLAMTFGYIAIIACYMLRVRSRERSSLRTIGIDRARSPLRSYARGLLIGYAMITFVYVMLFISGSIRITGIGLQGSSALTFLLSLLMFIPQGASEEIMFRGFMIPRVASRYGKAFAVFLSSLLFGVFHAANRGFTFLALINLILIAVAFSLICLYTGEIVTTCAAHTIWNFSQGNLYGLEVSGNSLSASVINTAYDTYAPSFITGGSFGPEGGLFVTVVSILTILVMAWLFRNKHRAA